MAGIISLAGVLQARGGHDHDEDDLAIKKDSKKEEDVAEDNLARYYGEEKKKLLRVKKTVA